MTNKEILLKMQQKNQAKKPIKPDLEKKIEEISKISNLEQTPSILIEEVKVEESKTTSTNEQKLVATYVKDEVFKDVIRLTKVFGKSRSELLHICESEYYKHLDGKSVVKEFSIDDLAPKKDKANKTNHVSKNVLQLVTKDNAALITSHAKDCGYKTNADYLRDAIDYLLPQLKEKAN